MARFTVRIELHDASSEDYQKLQEKMDKQGFTDTVPTKNGAWVCDQKNGFWKRQNQRSLMLYILVAKSNGRIFYGRKNLTQTLSLSKNI
ncbi:MAG: hypothetical protein PHF31_09060 [Methylobacter sp.]|nr:hypothetical protein [Methylobacter sp.]